MISQLPSDISFISLFPFAAHFLQTHGTPYVRPNLPQVPQSISHPHYTINMAIAKISNEWTLCQFIGKYKVNDVADTLPGAGNIL